MDVSILVPACFENPLRVSSADFIADVLAQRIRAVLPVTSIIGAYHIAKTYLGIPRLAVKKILEGTLRTKSPALYPQVTPELAEDALNYAAAYDIESWDGFLISLTRNLGSRTIYSLDEQLSKVKEISVSIPFPQNEVNEYHEHVKKLLKANNAKST